MNKGLRLIKRMVALILVLLLSIENFAAVVSDNDGAAFITKAEFDSLKNNFQSQIDQYNTSIDAKIDGAIASYLSGINIKKDEIMKLMLWGGRKLGLVENEYSRPYVEGRVGGRLDITQWCVYLSGSATSGWDSGITAADGGTTNVNNPTFLKYCFHRMTNISQPFSYLCVDLAKTASDDFVFNLIGYCKVTDEIEGMHRTHQYQDRTYRNLFTIGTCSGVTPYRGSLDTDAKNYAGSFIELCEASQQGGTDRDRGVYHDSHSIFDLEWSDVSLSSQLSNDSDFAYITNAQDSMVFNGIRPRHWHGVNMTNGTTEQHTKGDMHMFGWTVDERGTRFNFHISSKLSNQLLYNDGAGVVSRIVQEDPDYTTSVVGGVPNTKPHGVIPDDPAFYNIYKADIGTELTSNNLYSNELCAAIKDTVKTGMIKQKFEGVELEASPLYLGLPLVNVKEDSIVEIELGLLDTATYDIAFSVDGFKNEPISQSQHNDAGCTIEGGTNHIAHFTGPIASQKIRINVNKRGILFMKYGASGGTSQYIQLPTSCKVIR